MARVLITGVSGLVGYSIAEKLFDSGYEVVGTYNKRILNANYQTIQLDIRDFYSVRKLIRYIRPDIVVHSAAIADSDLCEEARYLCWATNYLGSRNIAIASKGIAKVVYVSTAYVFDGKRGLYREEDIPQPVNYYGLTKLLGEVAVLSVQNNNLVLRLSLVVGYSPYPRGLLRALVEAKRSNKAIMVPKDQYLSPLTSTQVAEILKILIEQGAEGIYHLGGDRISRYGLAMRIAEILGIQELVRGVSLINFSKWRAKRPKDTSLDTYRIKKIVPEYLLSEEYTEKSLRNIISRYGL